MAELSSWITANARLVIAFMLIASAVVAAGVPMVDRSTGLDQFQTDAAEADALEYVDANFSGETTNTTAAQVIVQDDNVLDRETLVSILEYEQTLQQNGTISDTLVQNDSTRSVANLIATTSIREDRVEQLRTRERKLAETEAALNETLNSLALNPDANVRPAFDAVDENTSVNLTEDDFHIFADAVEERRSAIDGTAADDQNGAGNTTTVPSKYSPRSTRPSPRTDRN